MHLADDVAYEGLWKIQLGHEANSQHLEQSLVNTQKTLN